MASIYKPKKRLLLSGFERLWRQAGEGKRWVLSNQGKGTEFKGRGKRGSRAVGASHRCTGTRGCVLNSEH